MNKLDASLERHGMSVIAKTGSWVPVVWTTAVPELVVNKSALQQKFISKAQTSPRQWLRCTTADTIMNAGVLLRNLWFRPKVGNSHPIYSQHSRYEGRVTEAAGLVGLLPLTARSPSHMYSTRRYG